MKKKTDISDKIIPPENQSADTTVVSLIYLISYNIAGIGTYCSYNIYSIKSFISAKLIILTRHFAHDISGIVVLTRCDVSVNAICHINSIQSLSLHVRGKPTNETTIKTK